MLSGFTIDSIDGKIKSIGLAFRWTDQGLNNLTDFSALLARMIMYMIIIGMAYWILKAVIKDGSRNTNRANIWEAPIKGHLTNEDNGRESSRDNTICDYGYDDDWDDKGDIDDYTIDPEDSTVNSLINQFLDLRA